MDRTADRNDAASLQAFLEWNDPNGDYDDMVLADLQACYDDQTEV